MLELVTAYTAAEELLLVSDLVGANTAEEEQLKLPVLSRLAAATVLTS